MLYDFKGGAEAWRSVNDGVMGGLSESSAKLADEGMVFSGNLSLKNNGGFSSIRDQRDMDLSAYPGIRLKVRGDGRTYQLRLQTNARYRDRWAVSFSQDFKTVKGEWVEVFLPFSELRQSWRGRQLSGYTFDASKVQMIGLMLADRKEGLFQLEVEWIGTEK